MNIPKITTVSKKHHLTGYRGFTLIELMVAIAIIGILATITIPSLIISRQRSEVVDALHMSDTIRDEVTAYYNHNITFPSDNAEAGVPEPEFLIANKITRMEIEDGAIHITLGNKISKPLRGKTLSLRPAIVTGSPTSPISWLCGEDTPVTGMQAVGENKTDLDKSILPAACD